MLTHNRYFFRGERCHRAHVVDVIIRTIAVCFLLIAVLPLQAQEVIEPDASPDTSPDEEDSLERQTLAKDILILDFFQLQALLEREGLSVQGDINEFRRLLFEYYGLPPEQLTSAQSDATSNNIEAFIDSALEGGYFEVKEVDEKYIVLRGGVRMRLIDNLEQTTHTIEAEEIIFNQQQDLMTARGNVRYTIVSAESTEEFTGETLAFEVGDWEGFFSEGGGVSAGDDAAGVDFRYSADMISRSANGVVVMEDAVITSSPATDPYYSLRTSKIWILGPAEWALEDATLYVGEIPVFYFPYFFRPGDEIVFHPVFGTQTRNGTFIQTTTYLKGRKPAAEDRLSFLQTTTTENNERYLDGIFLRTGNTPLSSGALGSSDTLKLIVDYYSRLGAYIGLEGDFQQLGIISPLQFNVALSYSRHLYRTSGFLNQYTSLRAENGSAREFPVYSNLFGVSIPLRYIIDTAFGISFERFQSSIVFQLYSDRYVTQDFGLREEDNDFFGIILGEADFVRDSTGSGRDSFVWRATASYALDSILSPYISTFALNEAVVATDWRLRLIAPSLLPPHVAAANNSPERYFFYPDTVVAPNLSFTIGGTLLSPDIVAGTATALELDGGVERGDTRGPWESARAPTDSTEPPAAQSDVIVFREPQQFQNATGYSSRTPIDYSLTYSLQPALNVLFNTNSVEWFVPQDVDFAIRYSSLTSDNRLQFSYMFDLYQRYLVLTGTLDTQARYRTLLDTANLDTEEATTLLTNAYSYNYVELSNTTTLSSYFLQEFQPLAATNIAYTLSLPLFRYRYDQLDGTGTPVYESIPPRFDDDESVTTHNIRLSVALQVLSEQQTLTFSYRLPPLDEQVGAALNLNLGPARLSSNFTAQRDADSNVWELNPFTNNLTLTFLDELSLSVNTITNLETEVYLQTLSVALRTWFITTTFTAEHLRDVTFNRNFFATSLPTPWEEVGERALRPALLTIALQKRFEPPPLWKNRIRYTIDLASTIQWDWQRFTNSYFSLNFGFTLFISQFLDLSITSQIRNSQIYLYFDSLTDQVGVTSRPFFQDLLYSLNIFNPAQSADGLFKLQNIRVQATHHLADWDLVLAFTASPLLVTNGTIRTYEWDPLVSVSVTWRAISELSREISVDRDDVITIE